MKFNTRAFLYSILGSLLICTSLLYVSCTGKGGKSPFLDKCAAISCAYGGRCDNGSCVCPDGYGGTNCEIVHRDKFIGSWNVTEDGSQTVQTQYALALEKSGDPTVIYIKNLYNYFSSVRAVIHNDTITIPNQSMQGKVVFGKGFIYGDTILGPNSMISIRYEVIDTVSQLVDDFGYYEEVDGSKPSSWRKN